MKQTQPKKGQIMTVLLATLFFSTISLCIPAAAGGYSGSAPLKVGEVSIQEWPGETAAIMEIAEYLEENEDDEEATSSNAERATKSNAKKPVRQNTKKADKEEANGAKATPSIARKESTIRKEAPASNADNIDRPMISLIHLATPHNAEKLEFSHAD